MKHTPTEASANTWGGYLEIFTCTVIWAGFAVVAKLALTGVRPEVLASWRFLLAGIVLLPWLALTRRLPRKPGGREWLEILRLACFGVLGHNLCLLFGLSWASAYESTLITNTLIPILTPLLASVLKVEEFDQSRIPGLAIGATGVLLIFIGSPVEISFHSDRFIGMMLFLCSGTCWTTYTVLSRKAQRSWKPNDLSAWVTWTGALLLLPFGLWNPLTAGFPDPSWALAGKLAYMSVLNTVVAFFLWGSGVSKIGPARSAVMVYLVPVFTLGLAALVLDERPTLLQILGGGCAMSGVVWANRRELLGGWFR